MADLSLVADSVRSNPTRFDSAVQRYRFALDRLRNEPDDSDEVNDHLTDALCKAEDKVMQVPAESFAHLRAKADIIWSDIDSVPAERHVLAFFADLVRLSGGGASFAFDPAHWLARFERLGGGWVVRDGKVWLMWPEDEGRLDDCLAELKMRAGKPAVEALILARHEAREA